MSIGYGPMAKSLPFIVGFWRGEARNRKLYYLPRGGLARIDFELRKSGRKKAYFLAVERRFIDASNGVIFSSAAEQTETIGAALGRRPEYVIPDFVTVPTQEMRSDDHSIQKVVTFYSCGIARTRG